MVLFLDKKDCCGCGACVNACPRNAIKLVTDADGFCYPQIDASLCVECGVCADVCGYRNHTPETAPIACYAAAAKDAHLLSKSASGGVFAVLAKKILQRGGAVYGASLSKRNKRLCVEHIRIDDCRKLALLQGSKYVQSDIALTYREAKLDLLSGKEVLFSGTPCQVAGLQTYLGRKFDNLLTVDLICHGVPSQKMFGDFIQTLEQKKQRSIVDFSFRTKDKGQGMNVAVSFADCQGKPNKEIKNGNLYSYMYYFLKSYIYRENCYSCPYAAKERVSDITIGDYWGFHEEYPTTGVALSNQKGVSCVLINTETGERHLREVCGSLTLMGTEFERIARHNRQLSCPSQCGSERDFLLALYREHGYGAVEDHYRKTCRKQRVAHRLASLIPKRVKRTAKRLIGILR